ncbi:MAG TPA: tetratricopeptide repeat protein [Methanoregulaceae archaeon]|nr:tetratricopeptide repeat protein [Methanoregulaceae archaeon]
MTTPPDMPAALKKSGDDCFRNGDYPSAIRYYLRAIEVDASYIAAWNNLGYALSKSGRNEDAARCREKIAELRACEREQGETSPVSVSGTLDISRPAGVVRDQGGLRTELKIPSFSRPDQESSRTGTPGLPAAGPAVPDTDAPRDQGFWGRLKRPSLSPPDQDNRDPGVLPAAGTAVPDTDAPHDQGFWGRLKRHSLSSPDQDNRDPGVLPAGSTVPQDTTPDQSGFWERLRHSPKHPEEGNPVVGNPEPLTVAPEGGVDSSEPSRGASGLLSGRKFRIRSTTPHGQVMAGQDHEPQTARDALCMEGGEVFRFQGGRSVCSIRNCGQLIDGFDRVLEQSPDLSAGFRGIAFYSLGRYHEALADFDRELAKDPGSAGIWILRAGVLARLGREQDALYSCEQALKIDRESFDAWRQYGLVFKSLGHNQKALHALDQGLSLNPHSAEVWVARGQILHHLNRDHEALQSYDRALGIDPRSSDLWLMRARSLARLKREEEALVSLEQGIAANPDNPLLFICQGRMHHALGKSGEALAAYDRALTIRPDDASTWEAMGGVFRELGRYHDEAAAYDRAVAIDPENPAFSERRGDALARSGKLAEAAADFRKALAARPGDPHLILRLGTVLSQMGLGQEAATVLELLLEADEDGAGMKNMQGHALLALGRYREALASFNGALSRDPGNHEARQGLRAAEAALAAVSPEPFSLSGLPLWSGQGHMDKGDTG